MTHQSFTERGATMPHCFSLAFRAFFLAKGILSDITNHQARISNQPRNRKKLLSKFSQSAQG
eukprot:754994-Hanusia_phi.AAC.9